MPALKLSEDIRPVSDLKSHGAEIVRQVVDGRPVVLSRHGRAVAVVLSVDDFEEMQEAAERSALLKALAVGVEDIKSGRTVPHEDVMRKLESWADGKE
jgi:prevent-host-death family protein